jgi:hypothetical protein
VTDIPSAALGVLEGDGLAHLVTLEADGAPQVSCVWVGVDDGEIVLASRGPRQTSSSPMDDPPPGVVVRIVPQRLGGAGPWAS